MRQLVQQAVFGENRAQAQEEIKKLAKSKGIFFASTQALYEKMARGEVGGFTVPAFNLRTLTFDAANAVFRAAKREKAKAFILELAQSEMGYTNQTPQEYAACCLAAAIEEGWEGPVFLQGDHFKITQDAPAAIDELKSLIVQAIEAGFYNIDIDFSALPEKENAKLTAQFTRFIRVSESKGMAVAIGGEVGEIGGENTTLEQLRQFMRVYEKELEGFNGIKGLSKLAVQTGTAHGKGGEVDFALMVKLAGLAREYGLAGVVQHGASTLDEKIFQKFPKAGVCEIHLSTGLQNIIVENLPPVLRGKIKSKKDLGPLKSEIWGVEEKYKNNIIKQLEKKFSFFFKKLNVRNTSGIAL